MNALNSLSSSVESSSSTNSSSNGTSSLKKSSSSSQSSLFSSSSNRGSHATYHTNNKNNTKNHNGSTTTAQLYQALNATTLLLTRLEYAAAFAASQDILRQKRNILQELEARPRPRLAVSTTAATAAAAASVAQHQQHFISVVPFLLPPPTITSTSSNSSRRSTNLCFRRYGKNNTGTWTSSVCAVGNPTPNWGVSNLLPFLHPFLIYNPAQTLQEKDDTNTASAVASAPLKTTMTQSADNENKRRRMNEGLTQHHLVDQEEEEEEEEDIKEQEDDSDNSVDNLLASCAVATFNMAVACHRQALETSEAKQASANHIGGADGLTSPSTTSLNDCLLVLDASPKHSASGCRMHMSSYPSSLLQHQHQQQTSPPCSSLKDFSSLANIFLPASSSPSSCRSSSSRHTMLLQQAKALYMRAEECLLDQELELDPNESLFQVYLALYNNLVDIDSELQGGSTTTSTTRNCCVDGNSHNITKKNINSISRHNVHNNNNDSDAEEECNW